jgi:hypothetical protein
MKADFREGIGLRHFATRYGSSILCGPVLIPPEGDDPDIRLRIWGQSVDRYSK